MTPRIESYFSLQMHAKPELHTGTACYGLLVPAFDTLVRESGFFVACKQCANAGSASNCKENNIVLI